MALKEQLFEKYKNKYKNTESEYQKKLNRFDKIYERAEILTRHLYKENNTKGREDFMTEYLDEFFAYKRSVLKSFRNYKRYSEEENVEKAIRSGFKARLFEFRKKHGDEVYEYTLNGKTYNRSLDTWLRIYVSQEENITLEQMKDIVKYWQTKNPEYDAKQYRKSDSSVATIKDKNFEMK